MYVDGAIVMVGVANFRFSVGMVVYFSMLGGSGVHRVRM